MTRSLEGLELFLVEDNFLILYETRLILQEAGAAVTTAGSVGQGLALCDRDYHAAILDIDLPDGNVFPVAERLVGQHTPLIFHSGSSAHDPSILQHFPDAAVLIKPVSETQLIAYVQRLAHPSDRHPVHQPARKSS